MEPFLVSVWLAFHATESVKLVSYQHDSMSDSGPEVWNEKIAITRTARENILLYLYQEGKTSSNDLQRELRLQRETANQHYKFLEDNGFIDRIYRARSSMSDFELTDKGEKFVRDDLLGGNPPSGF